MKFQININYEEITTEKGKDYELKVSSEFSDDSAKIVGEILQHFDKKLAEHKNNRRYIDGSTILTASPPCVSHSRARSDKSITKPADEKSQENSKG